ncbi:hypothetical protein [Arabiibacter massiliensis]|uniref:hypothetical protein n=1 Tax=Arabiibacter massiliensis TaxID=1870985 RepID=UPI00117BD053|nr:hypothetical protein [Arabiibacter massiliensis]
MLGTLISVFCAMALYLLIFLFVLFVGYLIVRRAVRDGIMDARARIKELEEPWTPPAGPAAPPSTRE